MATKHTATYDGHTFKRSSASRSYTHTVIAVTDIASARLQAEKSARSAWARNLAYTKEVAAGGGHLAGFTGHEERQAQASADIAAGEEAYVVAALARFDSWEGLCSSDGTKWYGNLGWCSRLDLARKLHAKNPGSLILDAVQS